MLKEKGGKKKKKRNEGIFAIAGTNWVLESENNSSTMVETSGYTKRTVKQD